MAGFIAALIGALILGLFSQPTPPSWIGPAMDISGLLVVGAGAFIGALMTRRHGLYSLTIPGVLLWAGVLGYFGNDAKPTNRFYLPEPSAQQLAGHDVLLWLSNDSPARSRVHELSPLVLDDVFTSLPETAEELRSYVQQHASAIRIAWEADAVGREWVERIANAGEIAERSLTPEAPLAAFKPLRNVVNLRIAYALLQAEYGDHAGAYLTLAPAIRFTQELSAARNLVHAMMGTVMTKVSYRALQMIERKLPDEERRAAAVLLSSTTPIESRISTILAGDLACWRTYFLNITWANELGIHSVLLTELQAWRFFFHPERTANDLATLYDQMLPALASREYEQANSFAEAYITGPTSARNLGGTLTLRMIIPALEKPVRAMWQAEDQRLALLTKLN